MSHDHQVLIIGGGLAGTALAIALARQGIRSTIFEIRPEPGDTGGGLLLAPNALRVLDKILGVYPEIRDAGFMAREIGVYFDNGSKVGVIVQGDEIAEGGYPAVRIPRTNLHKILLRRCEAMGEPIRIEYGKQFTAIEEVCAGGVTVSFDDGSSARGTVLVGADGIHSRVRQFVLGPAAPLPKYSGLCSVSGECSRDTMSSPPPFELPAFIYSRHGMLLCMPSDSSGRLITWGASKDLPEKNGRKGWDEYRESGEAGRAVQRDYRDCPMPFVREIMGGMKETELRLWAPYEIPDLPTWHTERVCLIGDAAHAIPPSGGQGSAQAFEDAAFMARLLASAAGSKTPGVEVDYGDIFGFFEKVRRRRFERVRQLTKTSGRSRGGVNTGWEWTLKKLAIRLLFALKRGVLRDTRITDYDVEKEILYDDVPGGTARNARL